MSNNVTEARRCRFEAAGLVVHSVDEADRRVLALALREFLESRDKRIREMVADLRYSQCPDTTEGAVDRQRQEIERGERLLRLANTMTLAFEPAVTVTSDEQEEK